MLSEALIAQVTSDRKERYDLMDSEIAISVRNLGKMYYLYNRPQDRLKQAFLWRRKKLYREFWALRDVSFEVRRGEVLGVIGRNGAGKSTLLQILAGTLPPTTGEVQIKGRVAAMLELGSGFNPEFTGRENVYVNGTILGFRREEMDERFDEIAAFADIGDFMDQPVKLYSSGMSVRLAFAVYACLEPDLLIVDEVLSVGDVFFQQKCHARMEELIARRTAVILVSHNMIAIEKYSTRAMLLDKGRCLFLGQPNEAVHRHYHMERGFKSGAISVQPVYNPELEVDAVPFEPDSIPDWPAEDALLDLSQAVVIGEEEVARCTGVALCNDKGEPCTTFQIGDVACFYYEFELLQDIEVPIGSVTITNKMNIHVHAKNSMQYLLKAPSETRKGVRVRFRQTIELAVAPGEYTFLVGLATMSANDYVYVTEMDNVQLHSKLQAILRVRQAGRILVRERAQGVSLPFYGYVDLKGDCVLSVLNNNDSVNSSIFSKTEVNLPQNAFYVASYPRSGNTWLLNSVVMLFGAIRSEARSRFEQYPYLYGKVGPDSFYLRTEDDLDISRPLAIKSHETWDIYKRLYPKRKCIYIYRDGRDVLLSFYFYRKAFALKEELTFERVGTEKILVPKTSKAVNFEANEFAEFLRRSVSEWADHVTAWLKADDVFRLRYEDLHHNFVGKLMEIIAYLDIQPAVSLAEVKKEYVDSFRQFFSGDNHQFFRKGVIGDWQNYFTEEHNRIFSDLTGDLLARLGYS